jgi:hypothetical protein
LTQAFFEDLLEREALRTVAREKGKFRSFLLAALSHFLNNEYGKGKAHKRGGGYSFQSWDQLEAEERYANEPLDRYTPERLYERRCAYTLVEQVLSELRQQYGREGKTAIFDELSPLLSGEVDSGAIGIMASRLGMSQGATKVALHRLRRRFGTSLRNRVAFTVASPDQVDEEIRYLFSVIAG